MIVVTLRTMAARDPNEALLKKIREKCEAYESFRILLEEIRSKYQCLDFHSEDAIPQLMNPHPSKDLNEKGMEFIRGGILAVMAAWESYVSDLFDEAFEVLIIVCSGPERNLEQLQAKWPTCRKIIEKTLKNQKDIYNLLEEGDKNWQKFWMQLLHEHRRSILDQRTFLPIFDYRCDGHSNIMTIDELFIRLFEYNEKKISQMLIEVAHGNHFMLSPGELRVSLDTEDCMDESPIEALRNISSLYYGLRCIFVDGKKERVIKEGPLKDFPKYANDFLLPDQYDKSRKVMCYMKLYKIIREYERSNMHVSYLTFICITNFIRFAAIYLMRAVAKWIYELQREDDPVWSYPTPPNF